MNILDRYIIGKYLGTFFFIVLMLVAITVVIDMSEKLEDFIDNSPPLKEIILDYYLNFIPHMASLLAPYFIFIAVIYFTSKLASNSEIIAILSGGVSYYRFMVPYLVAGTMLAGFLYYANNWLVPAANKGRLEFEYTYLKNKYYNPNRYQHLQVNDNSYMYVENFSYRDTSGHRFTLGVYETDTVKLKMKIFAAKIKWKSQQQNWRLSNYYIRNYGDTSEVLVRGEELDTTLGFTPDHLIKRISRKEEMNLPEINKAIAEMKLHGSEAVVFLEIEKFRRTSSAFSVIILTIIGMSIASRKIRGGLGLHIVIGIFINSLYELTMKFSTTFSTNAELPPVIGVWVPNIIFGLLAIYLLRNAQQ